MNKFQVFYLKQRARNGQVLKQGTVWIDGTKGTYKEIIMLTVNLEAKFGSNVPEKLPSFYLEGEFTDYEIYHEGIKIWG